MSKTEQWAASYGLCVDEIVPPINDYTTPYKRTTTEVANRSIILHCVSAVGCGVNAKPVIDWLKDQLLWNEVSPLEQNFLCAKYRSDKERNDARWRQEALWALLWAIGKIEALGLPTQTCDTERLVDNIMPALGDPINSFISSAELRLPSELLGEDDRIYNLHCYARQAYREDAIPDDLVYDVLFQRHYAFEWLNSNDDWDNVQTNT
jgi:hypothetical protein